MYPTLTIVNNDSVLCSSGGGGGENLTLMLVTVVTVFIVCQLPNLGIRVAFTAGEFAPRGLIRLDLPSQTTHHGEAP